LTEFAILEVKNKILLGSWPSRFFVSRDTQTTGTVVPVKRPQMPSGLLYGFATIAVLKLRWSMRSASMYRAITPDSWWESRQIPLERGPHRTQGRCRHSP
jgi:hypothetical protein